MPTIAETLKKIDEFADLPDGWHFGDGVAPSSGRRTVAGALLVLAQSLGLERANAFPGVGGQIELRFYRSDAMLEITFEADNSITIAKDEGHSQIVFEERASLSFLVGALREFAEEETIWASLESSIEGITIQSARFSQVPHLIFMDTNPSLWSSASARLAPAEPFAVTSQSFMLGSPVSRLFNGGFLTTSFPMGVRFNQQGKLLETIATTISTLGVGKKLEKCL